MASGGRNTDNQALRAWLRLLACTNLIESRIRPRLQSAFATTLPRFDFLAQLERAADGLKMSELSHRMMVTGGNVTGIAHALESEGLIRRESDSCDRRALRVRLTPEGRRAFARMASAHERWVIELFGTLTDDETRNLVDLLNRLRSGILDVEAADVQ